MVVIELLSTITDLEEFDKEFDARTLSEQGFSIGKGSLNLDSLKHIEE
jgi:hypothetical protein